MPSRPPEQARRSGSVWPGDVVLNEEAQLLPMLVLICERGCSSTEASWSWLVLRWWLGVVDRAGVKVERPEHRVDDDLDAGEGRHAISSEEKLGSLQRHHLTRLGLERGARA